MIKNIQKKQGRISVSETEKIDHNKSVMSDIIKHCKVNSANGQFFLRWSTDPKIDALSGFTAPHQYGGLLCEDVSPFTSSLEHAVEIMHENETEQEYFTIRELGYRTDSITEKEISSSKVFEAHNFPGASAHTCPPVYDLRNGKVIINPEFGLACYHLGRKPSADRIRNVMRQVSNGLPNQEVFWHVYSASHYHHCETNSNRNNVMQSDKIVCILNAEHLGDVATSACYS